MIRNAERILQSAKSFPVDKIPELVKADGPD